jgi:hypothetical protein
LFFNSDSDEENINGDISNVSSVQDENTDLASKSKAKPKLTMLKTPKSDSLIIDEEV